MAVFEITQVGIDTINSFDSGSNMPVGNFGFCNTYNVDPTTFNSANFRALTTVAQQQAYLANAITGARNGYATPPNFPAQGNSVALNRAGNAGSIVANQPALRINKISVDQTNYLFKLQSGYGNYFFNLLVVYNTINTPEVNRFAAQDMPIAFIYLFNGMQNKTTDNEIEINAVFQYAGLASVIEFVTNPVTSASLLEVSSPDFLPNPATTPSNVYSIRNPSPATTSIRGTSSIATLVNDDLIGGNNNILLWQFSTHEHYIETITAPVVTASPTRCNLNVYTFFNVATVDDGFIMQVVTGPYAGQCRRLTEIVEGDHVSWATPFAATLPVSTRVRIYIPNRKLLNNPSVPSADQVLYGFSLRATKEKTGGFEYVYDGQGANNLILWPNPSLGNVSDTNNGDWLVGNTTTDKPNGMVNTGVVSHQRSGSVARQTVREFSSNKIWESLLFIGTARTPWVRIDDNFQEIANVADITPFTQALGPSYLKYIVSSTASASGNADTQGNSIVITKSSNINNYWSLSTHSKYVCSGTVTNNSIAGSQSTLTLNVLNGKNFNQWSIDPTELKRFIIQFRDINQNLNPNTLTGRLRGIASSNINVGLNNVTVTPTIPTYTGAGPLEFVIYECNIAALKEVEDKLSYTYEDLGTNSYSYTLPGGFIVKGGGPIPIPDGTGTSFTFASLGHSNFPTKCYNVFFQADNSDSADTTRLISKTTTGFTVRKNGNDDAFFYWEAKGE